MTFRMTIAALGLGLTLSHPVHAATDTVTYTYDPLGRLSMLSYANGTTITYTYDLAGNRLSQQVACGSGGC